MKIRLVHGLVISFVATVVVTTVGIVGVLTWNLQKGFSQFLQSHDQKRLNLMAHYLGERVAQAGSLEALLRKVHWPELMHDFDTDNREADGDAPSPMPPPHPVEGRERPFDAPPNVNLPKTFAQRVALYDTAGAYLDGPPLPPASVARRAMVPIVRDGQTLAQLQMEFAKPLPSGIALDFLGQQTQTLVMVAVGLSSVMLLLGMLLSRWLLRMFAQLQDATSAIADGALHTRILHPPEHEIGALMRNINRMAENLERHHQSQKRWIANISHELRTPVSVLQGEVEAVLDGVRPLSMTAMTSMREEVQRLGTLINDLHLLSLSDLQQLPCHFAPMNVARWLQQTLLHYQPLAIEKSLTLTHQCAEGIVATWDAERMTQVLRNLLDNSLRYTDQGGQIQVQVRPAAEDMINICVEDSAPGLGDAERLQIFEPLYRADAHRNRQSGGSGLGLAICRAIVQSHGGSIHAEASSWGGLRILIQLPLHHATE